MLFNSVDKCRFVGSFMLGTIGKSLISSWKQFLTAMLVFAIMHSITRADVVIGGWMIQNLDSAVFRDPASADEAFWSYWGAPLESNQPLLIFGNHVGSGQTGGKGILDFRPLPVDISVPDVADPDLPRVNYRDDAATIEASIMAYGSTSALPFGVNGITAPSGLPGRAEQSTTLSFDPVDPIGTATGAIGLDGVTSFWYANTAAINTGSVWMAYGDLSLANDPASAINGNSGWVFTNHLLYTDTVYDIRDFAVSDVVPATASTQGSLKISGNLYVATGFAAFGIDEGLAAGSFTINAITTVPEPEAYWLTIIGLLGGTMLMLLSRQLKRAYHPSATRREGSFKRSCRVAVLEESRKISNSL